MDLAGKKIIVIGLGRTGVAVARFLLKKGSHLVIADDKTADQLAQQVAQVQSLAGTDSRRVELCLGDSAVPLGMGLDLAVVSPGVPLHHPVVNAATAAGVPVISEIELAYHFLKGRVVGVTGSNGKTTCTLMIGAILARQYAKTFVSGNIGVPLIDQVELADESSWHSVELSSFQLEGIDCFRPNVAVMLNLTPDHLDRHGSLERYRRAKERIFKNQTSADVAVLNSDDITVAGMTPAVRASILWFSRKQPVTRGLFVRDERIFLTMGGSERELLPVREIPLRGSHNVENVLACAAAGVAAGVAPQQIAQAVRHFKAPEHRLEHVETIGGVAFYNDSKATNLDAAVKAIDAFSEPLVVIMGGRDKGADFSTLRPVAKDRVKQLILMGEAAASIENALAHEVPTCRVGDIEEAVRMAFGQAQAGDVVLLAPACASFDMFRDYEQRGDAFKSAVRRLREK